MRPLLGSATSTDPFNGPSASKAASRTVRSSPFRSSPSAEFPLLARSTASFQATLGLRVRLENRVLLRSGLTGVLTAVCLTADLLAMDLAADFELTVLAPAVLWASFFLDFFLAVPP